MPPSLEYFENSTSLKFNLLGAFDKDIHPEDWDIDGYKDKISKLSEYDAYDCAFQAAIRGNVELLRLLYQERKDIQVVYENLATKPDRHVLNGITYRMENISRLKDLKSLAQFKDLLKAIDEFGIKGLSDLGPTPPALFHRIDGNTVVSKLPVERFSGDLPFLTEGKLTSPELAIALKHEASINPHSESYKPILCWASPEMIDAFPQSLVALQPLQEIGRYPKLSPMADFKADSDCVVQDTMIVTGISRPKDAVNTPMLMESLCPLGSFYGFHDPQGRRLCETTTDFLLGFDIAGVSERNTQSAKDFAKNYLPIKIIATNACEKSIVEHGYRAEKLSFGNRSCIKEHHGHDGFNDLLSLLVNGHPLQAQAREMLKKEQWAKLLLIADGKKLLPSSLIGMYHAFGVDNTGLSINVSAKELNQFLDGKYKFSSGGISLNSLKKSRELNFCADGSMTAVLCSFYNIDLWRQLNDETHPKPNIVQATKDFLNVVVELNLWPAETERPKDLTEALRRAMRKDLTDLGCNDALGLRAILVDAGIEACISIATTPQSWLKIAEAFPRDVFEPYVKQMPRAARGKLLEQDLGI